MCPDAWANNLVKLNLQDLEGVLNEASRTLARAGVFGAKVTGIPDATDLEPRQRYLGT